MKMHTLFTAGAVILSLAAGGVLAQTEVAQKQAEIRKVTATSLEKFYKADPKLKAAVAKAPGDAVYTTHGWSFLIGGAGGNGLAQHHQTKQVTYLDMAQASAGLQIGASESETLIIFKNAQALQTFIDKGWEASGGAVAQAGAGGKSAGPDAGAQVIADASYYTLTKNGLQAGVAVAGTKYWKDKDLN